jgi:uncharacterized protein YdaU (DUF1376 family)
MDSGRLGCHQDNVQDEIEGIAKGGSVKYYPHHIGDFDKKTRHLTRTERSIYRDLIDLYYDTEQPLTLDMKALCRKVLARTEEESTAVEQVLNEFFTKTEQGWYHSKCEEVIQEYRDSISAKSAAGKASAAKRETERLAKLNSCSTGVEQPSDKCSTDVQLTNTQEPITNNQKPSLKHLPAKSPEDEFEEAWTAYPQRPGASKKEALQAWSARLKTGVGAEVLIAGVRRYAAYVRAMGTDPQYIKQPKSFFGPGEHYLADWTVTQAARASPMGYESAKDRSRREAAEKLTGRKQSDELHLVDIN